MSALASSGRDNPIKTVGHNKLARSTAAATDGVAAKYRKPEVKQVVVQPLAEQPEDADTELREREAPEAGAGSDSIRQTSSRKTSKPEPHHEGGNDDRDGVDVGAGEDHEEPLPDHLIEQRRESREEENEQRDRQGAGTKRPRGTVGRRCGVN